MPEKNPSQTFQLLESSTIEPMIPKHEIPWFWIALISAVIAAVLVIVIYRHRKRANDPEKIREKNFQQSLADLDAITNADAQTAAVQSSMILRKYLSIAANDPALYETHEEFIARHDALQKIPHEKRNETSATFDRLAALKYAPATPDARAESIIGESRNLLLSLHAALAP